MYPPRNPFKTEIHQLICENYQQVFYEKERNGMSLPYHLEREFKKYLKCGILSYGMARLICPCCHKNKLVAFSCKGRICPSCSGRKMADTAKHLIEEVIPNVPVRQWVLSMPYQFRFLLSSRPAFLRLALAIYHKTVNQFYLKQAKSKKFKNPKVGAITVIQRFGGALNLNLHFHTLYMDGVFHENYLGEEVFFEIIPTHEDTIKVTEQLKKRLTLLLLKEVGPASDEPPLSQIQAMSVQNLDDKFRKPIQIGIYCESSFEEFKGTRCYYDAGFSLHANVKILSPHRDALEKLCRYILRGPLALDRISYDGANKVALKLKTPYSDGTTHLQFTPDQFIKRVISLIPPPRQNLIRYIGVFGARHKKRSVITAMAAPKKEKVKKKTSRTPWAELLKYVFKYEVDYCDCCGTKLVLIACIKSRYSCQKILNHLGLPAYEINPVSPRAPPELDFFDPFPEYL